MEIGGGLRKNRWNMLFFSAVKRLSCARELGELSDLKATPNGTTSLFPTGKGLEDHVCLAGGYHGSIATRSDLLFF